MLFPKRGDEMKPQLVSVEEAVAYGAKLSADFIYHYTSSKSSISNVTFQVPGINLIPAESLSSALYAAAGSEIGGKRSFVLSHLDSIKDINAISHMRIPIVLANISSDISDLMNAKNSGALIFMPENNQEAISSIIQAYKVSEDPSVLLPSIVNMDITGYSEPVQLPEEKFVRKFLSKISIPHQIAEKKTVCFGASDKTQEVLLMQRHKAMKNAAAAIQKTSDAWKKKFDLSLPLVDRYKTDDAEYIIVVAGFHSTTAKAAVNKMRSQGKKVGLLRVRVLRPLPVEEIKSCLKTAKKVCVFDRSVALGISGIMYQEIKPYHGMCSNFISIGKSPSEKKFEDMLNRLINSEKEEIIWLP
jgi:pyruvate ferredoxin oxidoreductase alpha subunit